MKLHPAIRQLAVTILVIGALAALTFEALANDFGPDAIVGPWATHEGGEVKFHPCDDETGELCGSIIALRPEDAVLNPTDVNNPDPALRQRPILGITMFMGLEADSDGKWSDGQLYNTLTGKQYDSKIRLLDADTLKISGCIGFFCRSFEWQRISSTPPEEHTDE
jgi:uncharacterized protein (DUF2147 family)